MSNLEKIKYYRGSVTLDDKSVGFFFTLQGVAQDVFVMANDKNTLREEFGKTEGSYNASMVASFTRAVNRMPIPEYSSLSNFVMYGDSAVAMKNSLLAFMANPQYGGNNNWAMEAMLNEPFEKEVQIYQTLSDKLVYLGEDVNHKLVALLMHSKTQLRKAEDSFLYPGIQHDSSQQWGVALPEYSEQEQVVIEGFLAKFLYTVFFVNLNLDKLLPLSHVRFGEQSIPLALPWVHNAINN